MDDDEPPRPQGRLVPPYATCPHCGTSTTPCDWCTEGHVLYGDGSVFPCPHCGGRSTGCPDEAGIYFGDTIYRGCQGWVRQIEQELKS